MSIVGQKIGDRLNEEYRSGFQAPTLTREQVTQVLVDLKRRIQGDLYVIEESDEKLVLGNRACPFGELALGGALRGAAVGAREREPAMRAARLHVAVVDDNHDAANLLAVSLKRWGHDVVVAHDGLVALELELELELELVREHRPDVAVLDIGLPGIDGCELARRLRGEPSLDRCMLIAVSGYGQDADRQRAIDAGFDHHLLKPVEPAALMKLLARGMSSGGSAP
ncbi:response regulator [Sorangium sp. So ce590]|uniref:response regulator n=1 Tax=unclassified Sorangium TaxID=2621164 RepID=UPI003F634FF1